MKSGQQVPGVEQKLSGFSTLQDSSQNSSFRTNFQPRTDGDVIDISNDDDEEEGKSQGLEKPKALKTPTISQALREGSMRVLNGSSTTEPDVPIADPIYKEKIIYKPNLVQRKAKMPLPVSLESSSSKNFDPAYRSHLHQSPPKWEERKIFGRNVLNPASSTYNKSSIDAVQKNQGVSFATRKNLSSSYL